VVRAGALGDLLLLRRTLLALRQARRAVALLAPEGPGQVLQGSGPTGVDTLLDWDSASFAPLHQDAGPLPEALRLCLRGFAAALVFSRSAALVERLGEVVPAVLQRDPAPPPDAGHAEWWLAGAVRELGIAVPDGELPPLLAPPEEGSAVARGLPEGFLAIHPGSGSTRKNWPASRFAALADALAPGAPFALIEGPADREAGAQVARLASRAVVVRGHTPRRIATLLSRARVFVGNDSGISHLAAAVGTPTLALFGPTDPATWAPVGAMARTLRAPGGDLARLHVETVVDYVSGAWTSSRLMRR
jgi:hypothetical protein